MNAKKPAESDAMLVAEVSGAYLAYYYTARQNWPLRSSVTVEVTKRFSHSQSGERENAEKELEGQMRDWMKAIILPADASLSEIGRRAWSLAQPIGGGTQWLRVVEGDHELTLKIEGV